MAAEGANGGESPRPRSAAAGDAPEPPARRPTLMDRVAQWISKQNWIVASIIIPMSIVYDIFTYVVFRVQQASSSASRNHEANVRDVQRQVQEWAKTDQSVPMCTARPSWKSVSLQPMTYKSRLYKINIDLPNILSLDEDKQTVKVEPMVSIGLLNDYLIDKGWMLPIVPELDELTIGGLVMGGGIETTSKKYGLFQFICKGYELVLSDSSVIWCDKDNHTDLFNCIPFCYGTFGFLTAVELQIVPYKPYLKMTYHPTETVDETIKVMNEYCKNSNVDTVEGIIYDKDRAVIMWGTFVDGPDQKVGPVNPIGRWYMPWFYTYVETFLTKKSSEHSFTEFIPTPAYFHRHNKPFFWLLKDHISCANHPVFRYLLGWTMPIKFGLLKWLRLKVLGDKIEDNFITQDYGFHMRDVQKLIEKLDEDAHIYPIWLCPFIMMEDFLVHDGSVIKAGEHYVDIGVYGHSPVEGFNNYRFQRKYEEYCLENKGGVALYAKTFLTKEELYKMTFQMSRNYDRLRQEYKCENAFPTVYDKICSAARD